jgi:lipopolysaccharide export system permease protein
MGLFGRYLFRQMASAFVLVLLTLTVIVWLATILRQLNLVTSQGQTFLIFLQMTGLALPNLVALIAPNAYLMATLHTLDRVNGDSELIVMTAAGAPVWTTAKPFLAFAAIVSAAILVINLWLMPASARTLRDFIVQVRTDLISQVLQPGRFSSPDEGLTFHIRDRSLNGDLMGLVIHDGREPEDSMTYLAERGRIIERDGTAYLAMFEGHIHRAKASARDDGVQIVAFEQYIFDISSFGEAEGEHYLKPRERYLSELVAPAADDKYAQNNLGKLRAEAHDRFATPLYPFVFAMIAIAFLARARTTRQGRWSAIAAAFVLAVIVRATGLMATNFNAVQPWAVVLVYGIPITAILIAGLAAQGRIRFDWVNGAVAWLLGGVTRMRNAAARGMQAQ